MQNIATVGKDYNKLFMRLIIALGAVICLLCLLRFPVERLELRLLILSATTILLGSRIGIEFSRHKIQITVSDTFVFLTLLLYGAEAAVLVAAAEAFWSSFRFSKLWRTRAFNSALLGCSTFVTSVVVSLIFGDPTTLMEGEVDARCVLGICLLGLVQYVANSSIAAVRESLKADQPVWQTWKEYFLWTSVTYFAGATAAGVTAKMIIESGFYAFVATIPIISIIYFTYQSYRKQLEAKIAQAEQAERHAAEQERVSHVLRESEEHFRGAFDYAAVGMALVGTDGRWLRVNQAFCRLVGYTEAELLAMDLQSIIHPQDLSATLLDIYHMVERKVVTVTGEKRFIHKDGQQVWTIISASTVAGADGKPMHFIMQAQDITERKRAEEKLHQAAFYDSLTGLPNRAYFIEHLQFAIDRAQQNEESPYAVLFLDVDRFKNINDSLGHVIGDQLLIGVARRLEKCIRPEDMVSRLGGDEFAVLLNRLKNPADAVATAERIQKELAQPFNLSGHEVFCGGSIGVALSTLDYRQSEEILRDADTAMYRAKEQGKGRFEIFDKVMHARAIMRLQLENDLRRAVERQEFEVYYQPIINLQTGCIAGFEALVRWHHPERGMVSPADFIPVAEETELIVPIGHWVLHEACRQTREWQTKWSFPQQLTISVNLSGKQFKQPDLFDQIKQILFQTKLDPQSLRLEITESIVMDDAETAAAMLRQLRSLGVQLSIDDFGTGYSSLSYLHRFPVNILKVDRSFVSRMAVDEESLGIVETIIALAAKLKMKVVAEGVETPEQSEQLKNFSCDYGQGFLYSKPVPAEAAGTLIESEYKQLEELVAAQPGLADQIEVINEIYTM